MYASPSYLRATTPMCTDRMYPKLLPKLCANGRITHRSDRYPSLQRGHNYGLFLYGVWV